jgi:hypothetical protein
MQNLTMRDIQTTMSAEYLNSWSITKKCRSTSSAPCGDTVVCNKDNLKFVQAKDELDGDDHFETNCNKCGGYIYVSEVEVPAVAQKFMIDRHNNDNKMFKSLRTFFA